ncbi:MAG: nitroreductase family protein [Bacteroidetes bacterium]|nr:nitroreductase family protein [Bacteroidota bacterium]
MEIKKAIELRTSVRNFLPDMIPVEDLKEMVRLAACAPSVNNYQPWRFVAVTNKKVMDQMAEVIIGKISAIPSNESQVAQNVKSQVEWYATFFRNAPAVIAVSMDIYETILEKGVDLSHDDINRMRCYPDIQSAGAAIQNLLLAAVDMGYGACWMSAPMIAADEIVDILKIDKPYGLIAFVTVGKPAQPSKAREKKPVEEIFLLID